MFYFALDKTLLMRHFNTNSPALDGLDVLLRDPRIYPAIDSVVVTAFASPIASSRHNAELAVDRAEALAVYVRWQHPQVDRGRIFTHPKGIDWDGFWALIETTPGVPSRDRILQLKGAREADILERLRTIGGGETYRYLLNHIYPKLQYAAVRVVLKDGSSIPATGSPLRQTLAPSREVVYDTVYVERVIRDTVFIQVPVEREASREQSADNTFAAAEKRVPTVIFAPLQVERNNFAVKTNLLLWAVATPNLGVEFRLGRKFSLAASGAFTRWQIKSSNTFQLGKGGLDLKYWFSNDDVSFTGWNCGVWGVLGGRFDIQRGSGSQGDRFFSSGISAGYSFAVGRALNMELTASPGWFYAPEIRYYRITNNVPIWQQTRYNAGRFMFKCAINLVWMPGKKR
jgi:hypothetical protein